LFAYSWIVRQEIVPSTLDVGSVHISYDLVVDLDLEDPIGRQMMSGEWKLSGALMWLLSILEPGDTVLDLGAHFGTFAIPAAMLGARVIAVEGSSSNADVLQSACQRNRLSNIEVIEAVIDSHVGDVEFADLGPYGTISTPQINPDHGYRTRPCVATTVDDLSGGPFTWAKIDIEGKEQAALAGAPRSLRDLRGMVIESNGYMLRNHGTTPQQMVNALTAAGMTLYEVGSLYLRHLPRPFVQPETIVDFAAVKGRPLIPHGWRLSPARSRKEVLDALLTEAQHPIAEHRDHAERSIAELSPRVARQLQRIKARV
jgi:FkbM family methyltransferase